MLILRDEVSRTEWMPASIDETRETVKELLDIKWNNLRNLHLSLRRTYNEEIDDILFEISFTRNTFWVTAEHRGVYHRVVEVMRCEDIDLTLNVIFHAIDMFCL